LGKLLGFVKEKYCDATGCDGELYGRAFQGIQGVFGEKAIRSGGFVRRCPMERICPALPRKEGSDKGYAILPGTSMLGGVFGFIYSRLKKPSGGDL
jgi:hypothetical protein